LCLVEQQAWDIKENRNEAERSSSRSFYCRSRFSGKNLLYEKYLM
jgi:hypothetical protein